MTAMITFPIKLPSSLHKQLKVEAVNRSISLHALIMHKLQDNNQAADQPNDTPETSTTAQEALHNKPIRRNPNTVFVDFTPDFLEFWEIYPNIKGTAGAGGKREAFIAYNQQLTKGASHEEIINGCKKLCEELQRRAAEGYNISQKHASSWLRAECWRDGNFRTDLQILESRAADKKARAFGVMAAALAAGTADK